MKKYLVVLIGLLTITILGVGSANANENGPQLYINGEKVVFQGQSPVIRNGTTMVPARKLFTDLGANVIWDGKTKTVTIKKKAFTITFQVGSKVAYINGKATNMKVSAEIIKGTTLIPLRFACEALGNKLNYQKTTNEAFIFNNLPPDGFGYAGAWYNKTNQYYSQAEVGELKKVTSIGGFEVFTSTKLDSEQKLIKTDKGYLLYKKAMVTTN